MKKLLAGLFALMALGLVPPKFVKRFGRIFAKFVKKNADFLKKTEFQRNFCKKWYILYLHGKK